MNIGVGFIKIHQAVQEIFTFLPLEALFFNSKIKKLQKIIILWARMTNKICIFMVLGSRNSNMHSY